jgi:thimet oligopeptidase
MWSLVIAKDMFTQFKKDGLLNPEVAAKYRDDVLAASGTKPAAEMVRDFLGRDYSFQAYADWLNGKDVLAGGSARPANSGHAADAQ